jgi:hypothetical protein
MVLPHRNMQLHILVANNHATLDGWKVGVSCILMWLFPQLGAMYCLLWLKFYATCPRQLDIVASHMCH